MLNQPAQSLLFSIDSNRRAFPDSQDEQIKRAIYCNCKYKKMCISLHSDFKHELYTQRAYNTPYYSEDEREKKVIRFQDGLLFDKNNEPVTGKMLFVILPNHKIVAAPTIEAVHHSVLSSGMPVLLAGAFFCFRGKLLNFNNNSGHYKPHLFDLDHILEWISTHSNNPNLLFEDYSHPINPVHHYSAKQLISNPFNRTPLSIEIVASILQLELQEHYDLLSSKEPYEPLPQGCYESDVNVTLELAIDIGTSLTDTQNNRYRAKPKLTLY